VYQSDPASSDTAESIREKIEVGLKIDFEVMMPRNCRRKTGDNRVNLFLDKNGDTFYFLKVGQVIREKRYSHSKTSYIKEGDIMEERANWIRFCLVTGLVVVTLLTLSGLAIADVVTSNLTIAPSPCKRGDVLHFSATVYNSPNVSGWPPGTAFYIAVMMDGGGWVTENQTVKYPEKGKPVTINFTKTYNIPTDAAGGSLCFWAIQGGTNPPNKLGEKECVIVKIPIQERTKMPVKKY
jgi:hypothetical protein